MLIPLPQWKTQKGSFTLRKVLRLADTLVVPEQATLPVFIDNINAVMEIGRYCRDKRSGASSRGKKYFKYHQPGGDGASGPEQEWVMMTGGEIERLGGAEDKQNFGTSLRVAHDGPFASLRQRLTAQGGQ